MTKIDYYNFLDEADYLMKKYKEEQKELTEEVFLNFLKEMVEKYNLNKRKYDFFVLHNNFLFVTKNKQCYTIISFEKDKDRKIDFSGYSLETKEQGQKYFEENFKEYEKVDFLWYSNGVIKMNFQTMSNLAIYEILIALLIGEENEWKEKQKEFMKNVLKLMVYKRDNEKDFIFDLSTLTNVISLQSLLKLAIDYKDKAKENVGIMDFVKYISSAIEVDINDFLKGNKNDENWIKEMYKKTQGKGQGVYDVSVCIVAWRNVLTNLSSDYRKQKKSS